jgi:hypothetical protein
MIQVGYQLDSISFPARREGLPSFVLGPSSPSLLGSIENTGRQPSYDVFVPLVVANRWVGNGERAVGGMNQSVSSMELARSFGGRIEVDWIRDVLVIVYTSTKLAIQTS